MRPFVDSTDLLRDPPALRNRLAVDGYLYLPGLLPPQKVAAVRADVVTALDGAGWLGPQATEQRPLPSARAVREGGPGYFEPYTAVQRSQRFHELAHDPAALQLFADLFDETVLVHPRKIARTSLPHDDEYTPPHQDFRLIQGTVRAMTMWVPLGDCPASLGGLRMLSGSHAQGLVRSRTARGPGGLAVDVAEDDPAWCTTDYAAGDVVVFTSLTVHGALRNNQDVLRFSADFRYQPLDEPVVAGSLGPHFAPEVPAWPVLTHGWTSTASVATPPGVRTVAMRHPLDPELEADAEALLSMA